MPLEDSYRRQVELLVKALPSMAQEPCFAIKGGTAINLFVRDSMPRLSVDIDLTYLPVFDRDESLQGIDSALHRIASQIEVALPSVRVAVRNHKVWMSDGTTQIKAEARRYCAVAYMNRGRCRCPTSSKKSSAAPRCRSYRSPISMRARSWHP